MVSHCEVASALRGQIGSRICAHVISEGASSGGSLCGIRIQQQLDKGLGYILLDQCVSSEEWYEWWVAPS